MMDQSNTNAMFFDNSIIEINEEHFKLLKNLADKSYLKRARLCLHKDHNDLVHEMIIAFTKDSFIPPHIHENKSESFHIIEGELMVLIFDDFGNCLHQIRLSSSKEHSRIYRLNTSMWHSIVPLSDYVIIQEVTRGPFIENRNNFDKPKWVFSIKSIEDLKKFIRD
jgi:cupin fold WbuC family metalloprotein